jgi:hypothetical protein
MLGVLRRLFFSPTVDVSSLAKQEPVIIRSVPTQNLAVFTGSIFMNLAPQIAKTKPKTLFYQKFNKKAIIMENNPLERRSIKRIKPKNSMYSIRRPLKMSIN